MLTEFEYTIKGLYAHGWEEVTTEDTREEGFQRLKEYRSNEPGTLFKLVKQRVVVNI